MDNSTDPYERLRPPRPTPAEELCSCVGLPPIVLQAHLSSNPISCVNCNLEVPPEHVGFSEAIAEKIAYWRTFHDCFYMLWLDSGEFENWAKEQLENPTSTVNKRGLELVSDLNSLRRTYYWWFHDGSEDSQPMSRCPVCKNALAEKHGRHVCELCSILVAN